MNTCSLLLLIKSPHMSLLCLHCFLLPLLPLLVHFKCSHHSSGFYPCHFVSAPTSPFTLILIIVCIAHYCDSTWSWHIVWSNFFNWWSAVLTINHLLIISNTIDVFPVENSDWHDLCSMQILSRLHQENRKAPGPLNNKLNYTTYCATKSNSYWGH